MELESTNSGPTTKLPILKLGEYEMCAIRIKQYFQIQDYALWEVIENGDSWVSISQTTEENGITISKMSTPATAEEKTKKKNDVKARVKQDLEVMQLPRKLRKLLERTGLRGKFHEDDLEAMDLIVVTLFAKCRVLQLSISLGYFEKSAICIKKAREDQFRNQDNTRKQGNKEDTSKANVWLLMVVLKHMMICLAKQHQTKFKAITYKRGLDTVEAQLVTYRKNEPEFKGYGLENSKKESNVGCEKESDNSKENSDKSNTSKSVSEVEPKKVRENNDASIIEEWVSDDEEQDESKTKPKKKTIIPTAAKIEKPIKKSVRYAEMYRSQSPKGNQRN
ncbi:hypothetical protein Tco_1237509 [Tanacetum coccineum]